MTKTDDTLIALLTEIRDLQREQTELVRKAEQAVLDTRSLQRRNFSLRLLMNIAIVLFTGAAVYFYYHTLVTSLGGLGS
ncbi:MAG TPA: hypothetical protein VHA78_01105 [Candidatus Peribacteraceae bacterium]|nr:hypothetical protein [Candidatus Peribacteraceae bacterium]